MRTRILTAAALFIVLALRVDGQPFTLNWFTIDGGGGTSTGGVYTLNGTMGQPDAGMMSGNNYSLMGGFWGVVAVQTPGAPILSIEHTNGIVRVFWPTPAIGFVLDEATTLTGSPSIPWVQVGFPYQTNSTHIFIAVPAPVGNRFYRLHRTQ